MPIEEKYRCNICGFESNAPGDCPTDDEPMNKLCLCGSGDYATQCCESKKIEKEDTALVEAEVKADALEETLKEAEIVDEEEGSEEKIEDR